MRKFTNDLNIVLFLSKMHYFSFLGVLTIGIQIQNNYILQVGYEPHLSDKARSSKASRFSNTKIWYAYIYSKYVILCSIPV